jgi:hypothetical protein
MVSAKQTPDFQAKLAILFDESDAFSSDAEKQDRDANRRNPNNAMIARQTQTNAEPGCLPFAVRKMRAESNPGLREFVRKFQDRGKRKTTT